MGIVQPVFWVLILLGIMILIHELGHYWACLAVGVRVETFSIGFGARLFGFRRGDTDFRVSAVPLGGYVRMFGETPGDEEAAGDPRSFQAKARWQRAIVILAGPLMNVLLAIGIVTGLYMYAFPKEADSTDPAVSSIAPGSPAARAGVQPGDRIVQIGSQRHPNWQDVLTKEALNGNHPLPVVVQRKNSTVHLTVVPALDPKEGIGVAGWSGEPDIQIEGVASDSPAQKAGLRAGDLIVSIDGRPVASMETVMQEVIGSRGKPVDILIMRKGRMERIGVKPTPTSDPKLPWHIGVAMRFRGEIVKLPFARALVESLRANQHYATVIFDSLRSIAERRVSPKNLHGPIMIAKMSSEAAQEGPLSFLSLMAMISLNLAVFNLLPIPILDGGTLLMLGIEMLIQREVSLRVKETVFKVGFVFLMMVVVFVIYNDIVSF